MAVVLPSDDSSYFGSAPLRRSHSQNSFMEPGSSTPYAPSKSSLSEVYQPSVASSSCSVSTQSSAPSSPRTVHASSPDLSYASSPSTNFTIASDYDEALDIDESPEDHFSFPSYAQEKLYARPDLHPYDNLEPPPSPQTGGSYDNSPPDDEAASVTHSDLPDHTEHAEDDTAAFSRPSRQVDYLSHDWNQEDIWASWRYIVSRRGEFTNSARLENASWRTWMKAKNNLRTISPEALNWLKDCDVTWLYGPLQPGSSELYTSNAESPSTMLSKVDSFANLDKKPILKKRSMSEIMLQKSLSSSSLLKQATASVQAQSSRGLLRPSLGRANTDHTTFTLSSSSKGLSRSSVAPSTQTSGMMSPNTERKHIHFNEKVEQCIALDVKGDDEEEVDVMWFDNDSDSDAGGMMMKRTKTSKRQPLARRPTKRRATSTEGKTIAMLQPTTLKYLEDGDHRDTAMKHSTPCMSPSSSQETLRPSKQGTHFFFGEEEEEDWDEAFIGTRAGFWSPPSEKSSLPRSASSASMSDEPEGMRRTASGMLMPYESGEASAGEGLFGRVIETVNTARDIAHVIWNVGWRK